jgi:hypothetical protein
MKKLISISVFVLVVICSSQISCKKDASDPGYCGSSWATQLSSESTAMTNALTLYANNPTTENCNSYKAAYQNYLNALKPYTECTGYTATQKNDLENAIAQAEAEIDGLCN